MQPIGNTLALVGLAWVVGRAGALDEANQNVKGRPDGGFWIFWIKCVAPLGIAVILALGVRNLFSALVN